MKITFVLGSGFSLAGGDRVIAIYAQRLQERGHQVFAVSPPRRKPSLREQLRSVVKGKGWIFEPKNELSHFDHVSFPCKLLDRWRAVTDADIPDADVVVATWWETADWVAKLSPNKGAKAYFMQDYGAPGQELYRIVPTWFFPLHIITIAPWLVNLIHQHCGNIPVSLIPNAVDTKLFYAPPRSKQNYPTVGFNYRTLSSKGSNIALEAIKIARLTVPNLRLVAYGSEKPQPFLPLPPDTFYHYRPADEEIREIYSSCDAWLFPSRSEGFGLPILESMACRTPVIGTPAGAAPELLVDGAGMLVQPEDPQDMARAIEKIYQMSDAQWRAMSDNAYTTIIKYTWDDATDLFEAALYTAIERWQTGDFN